MGFLIFVTEQSVYTHQYCWREGVNIRLLTKFKGDTPKGWQRYCTTKPQNFIDVCMVGSANSHSPPTPPPCIHLLNNVTFQLSYIFVNFQQIPFKLGIFTDFTAFFLAVLMKVYVKVYFYWNIAACSVKSGT